MSAVQMIKLLNAHEIADYLYSNNIKRVFDYSAA